MRLDSRWLVAGLLVVTLATGLAGPAGAQDATSTTSITRDEFRRQLLQAFPMEEPAQRGGQLILGGTVDLDTLNGILGNSPSTLAITGAIYEPLVGVSPIDGQPVPVLADSWEIGADGRTYTFHLNQAATWQDGEDFTAEDVKASFDAVLDPNTGSVFTAQVNDVVESYRVVDPDTFEIVARDRLASFLYDAPGAVLIMPKHIWETVSHDTWSVDPGSTGLDPSRVVGTGPFKFKEWVQGDHVTLVRNDAYFGGAPYLDELVYQVKRDVNAVVQALEDGEIDVIERVPAPEVDGLLATGRHKVDVYPLSDVTFYLYNLDPARSPFFQDQKVRQALLQGLDRQAMIDSIWAGFGQVAIGTQPELSPAFAPDQMSAQYSYDPEASRRLLQEAGWQLDGNGVFAKDGQPLEIDLVVQAGVKELEDAATAMAEDWKEIGVKVNVAKLTPDLLQQRLVSHDFDVWLIEIPFPLDGNQGFLFRCDTYDAGTNLMHYCNARYDELDELQKRELDPAKRRDLLIEQANIVWTEVPVGPLRFGVGRTGSTSRLHNFYPNGYGFLWSLPHIWKA